MYFHFYSVQYIKKISLKTFFLTHGLFRSVLFSLPVGNFVDTFLLLILISLHYGWRTHSNGFNSLNLLCFFFSGPECINYLGIYFMGTWKEWIFCYCWGKCSTNVAYILMVDGGVELFCILSDVPCSCTISCWEKPIELFNYNCGFVCSSFYVCRFLLHVFYSSVLLYVYF